MPLYEYVCPACDRRVEAIRKFEEREAGPECGECGRSTTLALSAPARVGGGGGGGGYDSPPAPSGGGCGPGGCGLSFN